MKKTWSSFLFASVVALTQPGLAARPPLVPPSQLTDTQVVDNYLGMNANKRADRNLTMELVFRGDTPEIMSELCKGANSDVFTVRMSAYDMMGTLRSAKSTACLADRLTKERHYQTLVNLISAAGNEGDPALAQPLLDLYQKVDADKLEPNIDPRHFNFDKATFESKIIQALGNCGFKDPQWVPKFHAAAVAMTGDNRALALLGLVKMGDTGIYDLIVQIIKDKKGIVQYGDWDMDVLAATGSVKDLPLLNIYAPGSSKDYIVAELQVKDLPADQKVAAVIPYLKNQHSLINQWAADELGRIGTPEALKALKDGLEDFYTPTYAMNAILALRRNGKVVTRKLTNNGWQSAYLVK